ncbi:MAG: VCBS repeat-containing protein [bacterium]|nr:VCBS repeat-containing protein [bacterium]
MTNATWTLRNSVTRIVVVCTVFTLGFFVSGAGAQISFEPFTEYAGGNRPNSIATGDFNGDHRLDLVTANVNGDDISILLGDGDGTFNPTQNFAVGPFPVFVVSCELNGDARPDLAVAEYEFGHDRFSILLNETQDTNSMAFSRASYATGQRPIAIACGDLDGDGDLDLAVANQDSDDVTVFANDGAGGFQMLASYGTDEWPWAVQAADLNDDGYLDLAAANNNADTVSVLLQDAANPGAFLPQVSLAVGARPSGLAAGDLDGDGDVDLVTANRGTRDVSVLLNEGRGLQYARTDYDVGGGTLSVALGDVSHDGKLDIVVDASPDRVAVLPNDTLNPGDFLPFVDFPVASDPRSVTLGDFDGDDKLDAAAANTNPRTVSILLNRTPKVPRGISCSRLFTLSTTRTAGIADQFAPPTEPATPGPDLQPMCERDKDFDDASIDACFGHTFIDLPANIVSATLTVGMRGSNALATTDSLQLGLRDGTFAWGRRIGTGGDFSGDVPGLLPTPWQQGTANTFVLNLNALPTGGGTVTSILDVINAGHSLDVRVADDTEVDFLTLDLRYCQTVTVGGLDHNPVGNGVLTYQPFDGELEIELPDFEGGVGIDTGEADGVCVQLSCPSADDRGTALELAANGTVLDEPKVLGSMTIENSGTTGTFVTNFPDQGSRPMVVKVCVDDQDVAEDFIVGNGQIAMIPIDTCIREVDYLEINSETKGFRVLLDGLTEVTLPDGSTVMGDSIKIHPDVIPGLPDERLTEFTITATGAPSFTITGEAIQLFGQLQSSLGVAVLEPSADRLTLSNLGDSGDDGLRVHLGRTEDFHLQWLDPDPNGDLTDGAALRVSSTGSIGGGPEQQLGSMAMEKTAAGLSLTADFTAIDSPTQRLEVYDDGQLIAAIPGNSQPINVQGSGTTVVWPIAVDKLGGGGTTTCYAPTWPEDVIFDLPLGQSVIGDELRILAEGQGERLEHLDSFSVQAAGIPELSIVGAGESVLPVACDDPTRLCLDRDRFHIEVAWTDFSGNSGAGRRAVLSQDSGTFWFFHQDNIEIAVKVLDGRAINGHWWLFYGALTNVEYTLTVTDSHTGASATYFTSSGHFFSVADTQAIPDLGAGAGASRRSVEVGSDQLPGLHYSRAGAAVPASNERIPTASKAACTAGPQSLCLNGDRFRVDVDWRDFQDRQGTANAVPLTGDSGYFWFFGADNVELVIKVLDGRGLNNHWWVFYGALSNVEYTITVTDTVTGEVRTYFNPLSHLASRGDTAAFTD